MTDPGKFREALARVRERPVALPSRYSEMLAGIRRSAGPSLPEISEALDSDQRAVVVSDAPVLRVVAPAGSGKTHVMVNRILRLRKVGVDAERILVLTYDNSSKNELQQRIAVMQGVGVKAQTLNAFGWGLLNKLIWQDAARPTLAESRDRRTVCREALNELKRDPDVASLLPDSLRPQAYLDLFSLLKNQTYSVREPWESSEGGLVRLMEVLDPVLPALNSSLFGSVAQDESRFQQLLIVLRMLFEEYEVRMGRSFKIDFDDQKLLPFERLAAEPPLRERVQASYDHVIVDECQDLNLLDLRLIAQVSAKCKLTVVGDDDQAIYEFRGTSPKYLIELAPMLGRQIQSVVLSRNYRCPANLVRHAAHLIAHNRERLPKTVEAVIKDRECGVHVIAYHDVWDEAESIARWIRSQVVKSGVGGGDGAWHDFAALYRLNRQALLLQAAFVLHGVPYLSAREDEASGVRYVRQVLAITRSLMSWRDGSVADREDIVEALALFPKWCPGDDRAALGELVTTDQTLDWSLLERVGSHVDAIENELPRLRAAIKHVEDATDVNGLLSIVRQEWRGLQVAFQSFQEAVEEWSPMDDLIAIGEHLSEPAVFLETLGRVVANARRGRPVGEAARDGVTLSTYFRAKGRQFRVVVLPSLVEGRVPHGSSSEEAERRLFYVAVTRATHDLLLGVPIHIQNKSVRPSRFLAEMDLANSPEARAIT